MAVCMCGRVGFYQGYSVGYRWERERRHPLDLARPARCPGCLRAMEAEYKRINGHGHRYTVEDMWDDASNDPSERRRMEWAQAKRQIERTDDETRRQGPTD